MNAVCLGGRAAKLVDARFVRILDHRERARLEDHLIACGACAERYYRLQLADRVAANGPDDAFDCPSVFEIERIAADLGLTGPPPKRALGFRWPAFAGLLGAAALSLMLVIGGPLQKPTEEFVSRGASGAALTFAAFVIDGPSAARPQAVRPHDVSSPVAADAHFKLRASWADGATRGLEGEVRVVLVDADGVSRVVSLTAPEAPFDVASVRGAVSLAKLPPGLATIYVVTGAADATALTVAGTSRPSAEVFAAQIGDQVTAQRFDLEISDR